MASDIYGKNVARESICVAMLMLLSSKSIDEIKITELCDKAGISRTSFYRYYTDKEEIVESIFKKIVNDIKQKINNNDSQSDRYTIFRCVFEYFYSIDDNIIDIIKSDNIAKIFMNSEPQFSSVVTINSEYDYYKYMAMEASLKIILTEWIRNDMKEPPKYMAKICFNIFSP